MKFSKFKTDKVKEEQGIEVDAGEGLKLRIARLGNSKYREYVTRNSKLLVAGARRTGDVDIEEAQKINRKAASKHILLGWENLVDDDNQPIPFSSEKALELFNESPDFYNMVMEFAGNMSLFQTDQEESKGN